MRRNNPTHLFGRTATTVFLSLVIWVLATVSFSPAGGLEHIWSSYLGGQGWDLPAEVLVASNGNLIVIGYTDSGNFPPVTTGTASRTYDVFVSRFSPGGSLLQTRYLAGDGKDVALGAAQDNEGNILVTGSTWSGNFATTGAYDATYNGGDSQWGDAFVAKLRTDGSTIWSTYLGGSGEDYGWDIAADYEGNVYVTGMTNSTNFPTVAGYRTTPNGNLDSFVAKFSPGGQLLWSTYHGGSGEDRGYGLVLDDAANVYVSGRTNSGDFPTTGGLYRSYIGGSMDAYVSKFARDGSPVWSSYFGGTGTDVIGDIAWDTLGNIYLVGETDSNDLPTSAAWDATYNGGGDGFLVELSMDGALIRCTYFGGSGFDGLRSVALNSTGNVYVTGYTNSADFPTLGGGEGQYHGGELDFTVAEFNASCVPLYSSLLGGNGRDEEHGVAIDANGNVYVAGHTNSTDLATAGAWDTTYNGGLYDSSLTKLSPVVALPNLKASGVDIAPVSPVQVRPGDSLILSAFLDNIGAGDASAFWTEVWGSRTGGLTLDRFLADSLWLPGGLPGSGAYSWVTTVPLYSIPDGPYTVVYTVDRPGQVAESNERDNRAAVRAKRILVIRPQTQTDLAVEGFAMSPNPAQSGQAVSFAGRVVNRGSEHSGPFWIEFWGSWDWPYPNLNFFLCDSIYVANLDAGAAAELSAFPRQLYSVPTGVFQVGCFADRDDSINELDETNNYQFVDGQVFNSATLIERRREGKLLGADIAIVSADVSPVAPVQLAPGDTITLTTELTNRGTGDSGPFWLEYWGSRDGGVTLSDFLTVSDRIANLAPGATVRLTSAKSLTGVPDGPYSVVVFADRPRDVSDTDEVNNRRVIAGKRLLVIRPPTGANLAIQQFRPGPGIWPFLQLDGTVSNEGTADSGPFWVEFWACPGDPNYPWLDRFLCDSIHVDNLAPGDSLSLAGHWLTTYPSVAAGQYAVIAFVDRLDQVIEIDETDNYQIVRNVAIPPH